MAEHRKHARLKVELDVQYMVLGKKEMSPVSTNPVRSKPLQAAAAAPEAERTSNRAKSMNISLGGIRLIMPELLDKGTRLDLKISLIGEEKNPIRINGQVMWQKRISNHSYDTGIQIEELPDEEKERFTKFVFRQMYQRIGLPNWPGRK